MIVDSHTHVYSEWPFGAVADPRERGSTARLLQTLDAHGVARALLIGAIFKGGDSNALTIQSEHEHPDRFVAFPQLDSMGTPTYHTAGAAERLSELHARHGGVRGFTHYCRDYAWLDTSEGHRLFARAVALKHVVSIAVFAAGLATLASVAARFPSITFLVHHLGRVQEKTETAPNLSALRSAASAPNLWIKLSGFHHLSAVPSAYPHSGLQPAIRALYEHLGPRRLVWGSDSPVVEQHLSYRQALDIFRDQTPYIPAPEKALILGGNLARLFAWT